MNDFLQVSVHKCLLDIKGSVRKSKTPKKPSNRGWKRRTLSDARDGLLGEVQIEVQLDLASILALSAGFVELRRKGSHNTRDCRLVGSDPARAGPHWGNVQYSSARCSASDPGCLIGAGVSNLDSIVLSQQDIVEVKATDLLSSHSEGELNLVRVPVLSGSAIFGDNLERDSFE